MSEETFGYTTIKSARIEHVCHWCGQAILRGTTYRKWVYVGYRGDRPMQITAHPECNEAWMGASRKWGEPYRAEFGSHCRGCDCQHGKCECGRQLQQLQSQPQQPIKEPSQ